MRLEDKFFNSFFYLFFSGIFFSLIIVITILVYFSSEYLDEKTAEEVNFLEKRYAKSNLNSMNILLTNLILKLQVVLQEQATLYQDIAKSLVNSTFDLNLSASDVYNPGIIKELMKEKNPEFIKRLSYYSLWFIKPEMNDINQLTPKIKKQIYTFSLMTQTLMSIINENNEILNCIFFVFDETDLYVSFPFTYLYSWQFLDIYNNFTDNPSWCTNEQGEIITYYKFKCRNFYKDMMNAQKGLFDFNVEDQKGRKVFITPPYPQFAFQTNSSVFTICVKFNDILSNSTAYVCGDSEDHTLFSSFELFNENLIGYVAISSVGYNQAFYFPQIMNGHYKKTLGEFIFRLDNNYSLQEKTYFLTLIQKYMTSNYVKYFNKEELKKDPMKILDEITIDGQNGEYQTFFINNEKFNFCLYPIVIENMEKQYEHILTIIYIYNKKAYYNHMLYYRTISKGRLIFQMILYFLFIVIISYIISLSFKSLAKLIVIPIKNVHYMLEGINVGGEYRLEYLSNLNKKQEENLQKLNKINHQLKQRNSEKTKKNFLILMVITKKKI